MGSDPFIQKYYIPRKGVKGSAPTSNVLVFSYQPKQLIYTAEPDYALSYTASYQPFNTIEINILLVIFASHPDLGTISPANGIASWDSHPSDDLSELHPLRDPPNPHNLGYLWAVAMQKYL